MIVVGGGMAGVSIGSELARAGRRVVVLDMEATLAFHTTGRSAAMFLETYGGPEIRALTTASRDHLAAPRDEPLLRPLPLLHVARLGAGAAAVALHAEVGALVPDAELLTPAAAAARQPLLRPEAIELAVLEPGAMEIDVHALHQTYVRELRRNAAIIAVHAAVARARRAAGHWTVDSTDGRAWRAPIVVNAAGAWADQIAGRFGASSVGLRPLRRTAFTVDAPSGAGAPMMLDVDDAFYVKPDAGRLLCSPADETTQEPGDARPDTTEVARALDVINEVTTIDARHVRASWAGLRTFASDRNPVVGFDPELEGFFWFAGQGGYGIQTAPALARTGAALLAGATLPADVAARGVRAAAIAPDRPGLLPAGDHRNADPGAGS